MQRRLRIPLVVLLPSLLGLLLLLGYSPAWTGGAAREHAPLRAPDRIVLTLPQDPATGQMVSWRTTATVGEAVAQIAPAGASPNLERRAVTVTGRTLQVTDETGRASHHTVTFSDLEPEALYAYRVRGADSWSEWFHFRTASAGFQPFSFIYFGDAQNQIKSLWSRTIRAAFTDLPQTRFFLHAGDLVNQGTSGRQWGEWFEAGGWLNGTIPSLPVIGNHEYSWQRQPVHRWLVRHRLLAPDERRLPPHWAAHFAVPGNGPPGMEETVYYVDYQGVRILVLDSTGADDPEVAAAQVRWLEPLLRENPNRWTIVALHHPLYAIAEGRDSQRLREVWKPIFDRYGVDLVLQGHDHVYGRTFSPSVRSADAVPEPQPDTATAAGTGTMYVVSVAGPKMYRASEAGRRSTQRLAEDTQLYQLVHVEEDRIRFEVRTVAGQLYDAFDLVRESDGRRTVVERVPAGAPTHRCPGSPDRERPRRCGPEQESDLEVPAPAPPDVRHSRRRDRAPRSAPRRRAGARP